MAETFVPIAYLELGSIPNFASKVAITADGCWTWTASTNWAGYGQWWDRTVKSMRRPHRVTFELFVRPLDADEEIDHLCRNRACCNPGHLEPVSHKENIHRAYGITGEVTRLSQNERRRRKYREKRNETGWWVCI